METYGQTGENISAEVSFTDDNNIRGDATASYYKANDAGTDKTGDALGDAPTDAGKYWAEITLGTGDNAETAHVVYDIAPAAIPSVAVTGIETPVEAQALSTAAATSTENVVLNDDGAIDWDPEAPEGGMAAYAIEYTATVTAATAEANYAFTSDTTATVNDEEATVTLNDDGTLSISYTFGKTNPPPVWIIKLDKEVTWSADGIAIPVTDMFTLSAGEDEAQYSVTGRSDDNEMTGEGTYDAQTRKLMVTKCGTFTVGVAIARTDDHDAASDSALLTVNKANAAAATVTANNRTYDETEKPLVTVNDSTLVGGTMQYALGSDDQTAPDSGWDESIPGETDIGTYYVWYKVVGDDNHTGIEPKCIKVTIASKTVPPTPGDAEQSAPTELAAVEATSAEAADGTISGVTDQMEYSADGGENWTKVPEGATEITGLAPGEYLVRMAAKPGFAASEAVKLTVGDKLAAASPTYAALSGQDRQDADAIAAAYDADRETAAQMLNYAQEHGVSLDTAMLSPAALTALTGNADPAGTDFETLLARMAKRDGKSVTIQWNAVNGADGYLVYGGKAGGKLKLLKTLTDTKYTQKKLKKKTFYKYTVVAYKDFGGKQLPIAASKLVFVVTSGGKCTNVKSLKAEAAVSLGVGESKKLTVKQVRQEKKKKLKTYRKLAYESADPAVATVAEDGTVTAVGEGTTTLYVYAQDGLYKVVTVTVTAAPPAVTNAAEETNAEDALVIDLTEPEADEILVEAGDAVVEEEAPEEIAE